MVGYSTRPRARSQLTALLIALSLIGAAVTATPARSQTTPEDTILPYVKWVIEGLDCAPVSRWAFTSEMTYDSTSGTATNDEVFLARPEGWTGDWFVYDGANWTDTWDPATRTVTSTTRSDTPLSPDYLPANLQLTAGTTIDLGGTRFKVEARQAWRAEMGRHGDEYRYAWRLTNADELTHDFGGTLWGATAAGDYTVRYDEPTGLRIDSSEKQSLHDGDTLVLTRNISMRLLEPEFELRPYGPTIRLDKCRCDPSPGACGASTGEFRITAPADGTAYQADQYETGAESLSAVAAEWMTAPGGMEFDTFEVELTRDGGAVESFLTDATTWTFADLAPGRYSLTVRARDYFPLFADYTPYVDSVQFSIAAESYEIWVRSYVGPNLDVPCTDGVADGSCGYVDELRNDPATYDDVVLKGISPESGAITSWEYYVAAPPGTGTSGTGADWRELAHCRGEPECVVPFSAWCHDPGRTLAKVVAVTAAGGRRPMTGTLEPAQPATYLDAPISRASLAASGSRVNVSWGPEAGSIEIAGYSIEYSRDQQTWLPWLDGIPAPAPLSISMAAYRSQDNAPAGDAVGSGDWVGIAYRVVNRSGAALTDVAVAQAYPAQRRTGCPNCRLEPGWMVYAGPAGTAPAGNAVEQTTCAAGSLAAGDQLWCLLEQEVDAPAIAAGGLLPDASVTAQTGDGRWLHARDAGWLPFVPDPTTGLFVTDASKLDVGRTTAVWDSRDQDPVSFRSLATSVCGVPEVAAEIPADGDAGHTNATSGTLRLYVNPFQHDGYLNGDDFEVCIRGPSDTSCRAVDVTKATYYHRGRNWNHSRVDPATGNAGVYEWEPVPRHFATSTCVLDCNQAALDGLDERGIVYRNQASARQVWTGNDLGAYEQIVLTLSDPAFNPYVETMEITEVDGDGDGQIDDFLAVYLTYTDGTGTTYRLGGRAGQLWTATTRAQAPVAAPGDSPDLVRTDCVSDHLLAAGDTYHCRYTVKTVGNAGQTHGSIARAWADDGSGNILQAGFTEDGAHGVALVAARPRADAVVTGDPPAVRVGDAPVFTVTITNTSLEPLALTGLAVTELGDVTQIQGAVTATSCTTPQPLSPYERYECDFTATIADTGRDHQPIDLVATFEDAAGSTFGVHGLESLSIVDSLPKAQVKLVPQAGYAVVPGGEITFDLYVTNITGGAYPVKDLQHGSYVVGEGDVEQFYLDGEPMHWWGQSGSGFWKFADDTGLGRGPTFTWSGSLDDLLATTAFCGRYKCDHDAIGEGRDGALTDCATYAAGRCLMAAFVEALDVAGTIADTAVGLKCDVWDNLDAANRAFNIGDPDRGMEKLAAALYGSVMTVLGATQLGKVKDVILAATQCIDNAAEMGPVMAGEASTTILQHVMKFFRSGLGLIFGSPIEPHVYDAAGRHVGKAPNGAIEIGIPGASYVEVDGHPVFWLPAGGAGYSVEVTGTDDGTFDLVAIATGTDPTARTTVWEAVPVAAGEVLTVAAGSGAPARMWRDTDGDGEADSEVAGHRHAEEMATPAGLIDVAALRAGRGALYPQHGAATVGAPIPWTPGVPDPKGMFENVGHLRLEGYGHGQATATATLTLEVPETADVVSVPMATALNGLAADTDSEAGVVLTVGEPGGPATTTYAANVFDTALGMPYVYAYADVSPFRARTVELAVTLLHPDVCAGADCTHDVDLYLGPARFEDLVPVCTRHPDDGFVLYDYAGDPTPMPGPCDDPAGFWIEQVAIGTAEPFDRMGPGADTYQATVDLPADFALIDFCVLYGPRLDRLAINGVAVPPEELAAAYPVRRATYNRIPNAAGFSFVNHGADVVADLFHAGSNSIEVVVAADEAWEERPFSLAATFLAVPDRVVPLLEEPADDEAAAEPETGPTLDPADPEPAPGDAEETVAAPDGAAGGGGVPLPLLGGLGIILLAAGVWYLRHRRSGSPP